MKAILTQISRREYLNLRKCKLAQGGIKTRFQKGHVPANKGKKGIHMSPATEFKKGHVPANHKPVGTILVRNDNCGKKFRWIKIEEPKTWIPYARHVWISLNGPIPEGFFVIHKSTDTLDDSPSNLKLVDRAGHIAMMKKRTPGWKKKAIRSYKKTVRRRRREKAKREKRLARIKKRAEAIERKRVAAAERQAQRDHQDRIVFEECKRQLQGPMVSWWECTGCGFESHSEIPQLPCPKCNSLEYERIEQPSKQITLRRQAAYG
jgi:rubrerythrin